MPAPDSRAARRELEVDRLPDPRTPLQVLAVRGAAFDLREGHAHYDRAPHRHDYHELIWTRSGVATHVLDGALLPIGPSTVTVIGRGQVHLWRQAAGLSGTIVRFGDELLPSPGSSRGGSPLGGRARVVDVPEGDVGALEGLLTALEGEQAESGDPSSIPAAGHLLSALLLWLQRWAGAGEVRTFASRDETRVQQRFADLLERDFARHHDVGHYADALALPQAALSAALVRATGRTTKEQVVDRVMLEALRLLRFTDLGVGEIAFRVGFEDQAYFSRSFKRRHGISPSAFRHGAGADLLPRGPADG